MTRNSQGDEFYVGYLPRAPNGLAQNIARTVVALSALALATGLALILAQHPFPKATFEFQQYRDFAGVIEVKPYPALLVARPGVSADQPAYSRYLLVAQGKHGADPAIRGFAGNPVTLRGSLIYRNNQTMVELLPDSIKPVHSAPPLPPVEVNLGQVTLTGEIVDSKCFLGVMNPGRTKVHRDCAARCISGGIPPILVTADATYLLVGTDGRSLSQEVLNLVGETVEMSGRVVRSGETLIFKTEPREYRRK